MIKHNSRQISTMGHNWSKCQGCYKEGGMLRKEYGIYLYERVLINRGLKALTSSLQFPTSILNMDRKSLEMDHGIEVLKVPTKA